MFLRAELRRRRRRTDDESGFTLLEILVALLVLALAASGTMLVLVTGSQAASAAKLNTQAKALAQQRIEAMRNLPFHVDRQNGPYIDLLDLFYSNLSTTATTRTRGAITDNDAIPGETQSVRWFASGSAPNPTNGPFYQVKVSSIPDYEGFSQIIDTQFLNAAGTPIASSNFTGTGSYVGYDSQTIGKDSAPTSLLGVTVVTSWKVNGRAESYSTYTRIANDSTSNATVTSQGIGEYLRITSDGPAGVNDALTVDVNRAEADGSQTTGSSATASTSAFEAADALNATDVFGAKGTAASPGTSTITSSASSVVSHTPNAQPNSDCSWAAVGKSQVSNVTAATNGGLPQVPSTVGTSQTTPTAVTSSSLLASGGLSCTGHSWALWFDNQSTSYDSRLRLTSNCSGSSSCPLVGIPDTSSGSNAVTTGSAWVNASNSVTTPHWVSSGASVTTTSGSSATVQLFPGANFITDGGGLVNITISSAKLTCNSGVPSGGGTHTFSSDGSYSATVSYWKYNNGSPQRGSQTLTWSPAAGLSGALPALTTVVYQNSVTNPSTVLTLGDYISNWSLATSIVEEANNGLHQIPGVVNITTQPVRAGDATSSVGVQVGVLSCAADDSR